VQEEHLEEGSMTRWFRAIFFRDRGICQRCFLPVDWSLRGTVAGGAPELGHIIPVSKNGETHPYNLRLEHRDCNAMRGTDALPEGSYIVKKFLCKICGESIPYSLLTRPGGVPVTCSKKCSAENRRRNQAARNARRKKKAQEGTGIETAPASP
jgi:hypothetical protein